MAAYNPWAAFAATEIPLKIFIKENEAPLPREENIKPSTKPVCVLTGEEAKHFYTEVIASKDTNSYIEESKRKEFRLASITKEVQLASKSKEVKLVSKTKEVQLASKLKEDKLASKTKEVQLASKTKEDQGAWKTKEDQLDSEKNNDFRNKMKSLNPRYINKFLTSCQNDDLLQVKECLSRWPAVLNSTDDFGWSGLMCAAQSNSLKTVKHLLSHNVDRSIQDPQGRTAFSLAKIPEVIKLLNVNIKEKCHPKNADLISGIKVKCKKCNEYYESTKEKEHFSSTVHNLYYSKMKKYNTFYGIPESNRGYQLMLRNGWDKEQGLGPDGAGLKYPLKTILKRDRQGLGNKTADARVTHFNPKDTNAIKHRVETQRTLNKKQRNNVMSKNKMIEKIIRQELS